MLPLMSRGVLVCFVLFLGVFWDTGAAQERTRVTVDGAKSRLALVIGNSTYANAPLLNPAHDARAIAQSLRQLGFEVMEGRDLRYQRMMEMIDTFGEKVRGGE